MKRSHCLTAEERAEVVARCAGGQLVRQIERAMGRSRTAIHAALREAGLTPPTRRQAQGVRQGKEPLTLSSAALWLAYAGPGSGYPSTRTLAKQWGVSPGTVRSRLKEYGIAIRSRGEQRRLDFATGRLLPPLPPPPRPGNWPKGARVGWLLLPRREQRQIIARRAQTCKRGRFVVCYWCAARVWRSPAFWNETGRHFCSSADYHRWRRWWLHAPPDAPRPLILEKLQQLLREEPYKALPFTRTTLEKAGATIGAAEPELLELMLVGRGS